MSDSSNPFEDGEPCGGDPYEGDPENRCLFHTEEEKDAGDFLEAFLDLAMEAEAEDGFLDATRFVFPQFGLPRGFVFNCSVNFREARFTGDANFRGVEFNGGPAFFGGAEFSGGDANFRDAEFSGGAPMFVGTEFSSGLAIFLEAKFSVGYPMFWGTEFSGEGASFQGAEFSGEGATFLEAEFSGEEADFRNAEFSGGSVMFVEAEFSGGKANFRNAEFSGGPVLFYETIFAEDAQFAKTTFGEGADFERAVVRGSIDFGQAVFREVTDMSGTVLLPGGILVFGEAVIEGELRLQDIQTPTTNLDAWRRLVEARFDSGTIGRLTHPEKSDDNPPIRVDLRNLRLGPQGRVRMVGAQGARRAGIEEVADLVKEDQPGIAQECRKAATLILREESPRRQLDATRYRFAHSPTERFRFQNVSWKQRPAWRARLHSWLVETRLVEKLWGEDDITRVADEDDIPDLPGDRTAPPPDDTDALDPSIVADIYRGIRSSYERALNYAEAGRFHQREMEMRRLVAQDEGHRGQRTALTLYRVFARYGESAGRPLAWLLGLVIFWAVFETTVQGPLGDLSIDLGIEPFADQLMMAFQDVLSPFVVGGTLPSLFVRVLGIFLVGLFLVGLRRRYRRGSAGGKLG